MPVKEAIFIQNTRFGKRIVESKWLNDAPSSSLNNPASEPLRLVEDEHCYTTTELPYRYLDDTTQEALSYSKFYNTILLPPSDDKHNCANLNIVELLAQELSPTRVTEDQILGSELGDTDVYDRSEDADDLEEDNIQAAENNDFENADSKNDGNDMYWTRIKDYMPTPGRYNPEEWDDFVSPEFRRRESTQESEDTNDNQAEPPFQTRLKDHLSRLVQDESMKANDVLGYLHGLFFACRASGIHACNNDNCTRMKVTLERLIPSCSHWKGFELWALQLAACICSQEADADRRTDLTTEDFKLSILPPIISSMARDYYGFYPNPYLYSSSRLCENYPWPGITINDDYRDWTDSVLLSEVYPVLSWLEAIATGSYKVPGGELPGGPFESWVFDGLGGLQDFKLCPNRVAVIATSLPGKELNISALLPTQSRKIQIVEHPGHEKCTYSQCKEAIIDSTTFKQLHDCTNHNTCETTRGLFPQDKLVSAIRAGSPTAWSLDGLSLITEDQPFLAISHVWADGTGVGSDRVVGVVNKCLWKTFCSIAIKFGCKGIWWDTISVPADREVRRIALNNMHTNYADATVTLLHDLYLRKLQWTDAESACFAVVMSTWFTRGWTALELAQSGRIEVMFKSDSNGFVIKNLDKDILARAREPSSPCHQVATTAIRSLRGGDIMEKDTFLASFTPRYTSWVTDRLIIAGLLVGIDLPASMNQEEIYERIRDRLRVGESPKSERELDDCLFFQHEIPDAKSIERLKGFQLAEIRHLSRIRNTPDSEERDPWDSVWPGWVRDHKGLRKPKNFGVSPEHCWRVASCLFCRPHPPTTYPQTYAENTIACLRNPHDLLYADSKPLCDHVTRWSVGEKPELDEAQLRKMGFDTPFWTSWCPPDWESIRSEMLLRNEWFEKEYPQPKRNKSEVQDPSYVSKRKPVFFGNP